MEELQSVKGKIESKSYKKLPTGNVIYSFKLNGEYYTTFSKELDEAYNVGDEVSIGFIIKDGKYKNIKGVVMVKQAPIEDEPVRVAMQHERIETPLKVSILTASTAEEFEVVINKFNADNDVKYTQTHITLIPSAYGGVQYTAVLFYR
jgi:hypothetical protein